VQVAAAMKPRAVLLLVSSTFVTALPGCFDDPTCHYGEVLVRDGNYGDGVCVRRPYYTTPSGTSSSPAKDTPTPPAATPASGAAADPAATDPTAGSGTTTPTTPSPTAGTCGGLVPAGDNVRVVDKTDLTPALTNDTQASLADGSYSLVQATFYRTGPSASPVRSLKATLDVTGPTLTLNAQDTSVVGLPSESLTFLTASGGVVTKTCEAVHGSVSAWFFPFVVGATSQTQMGYGGPSGFVRVIVSRADGATELIFAR